MERTKKKQELSYIETQINLISELVSNLLPCQASM